MIEKNLNLDFIVRTGRSKKLTSACLAIQA